MFPEDEAARLLDSGEGRPEDARQRLLAGVRAESEARFVEAVEAIMTTVDWRDAAASDPGRVYLPLSLLGMWSFRSNGLIESGCDHLSWADVMRVVAFCKDPDASLGCAIFHALELGNEKALLDVQARVADGAVDRAPEAPSSDPVAALRYMRVFDTRLGASAEDRIRKATAFGAYGELPAIIATAAIASRNLAIDERPPVLQFARSASSRVLLKAASAISNELFEDILVAVASDKLLHGYQMSTFELAWDDEQQVCASQQLFLASRFGRTVWTLYAKLEDNGVPVLSKGIRINAKQLADNSKAKKELAKRIAEHETKLGGQATPRRHAVAVSNKEQALFDVLNRDGTAERAFELLAGGADPNCGALHLAVRIDSELVRRFLAAGADPSRPGADGRMPLDRIASSSQGDTLRATELLCSAGGRCGPTALAEAARWGQVRKVPLLAAAGGDPAAVVDGRTALEIATSGRFPRTVKALRECSERA
jgi:hypothetical protein